MPNDWGLYEVGGTLSTQVSSTYEGRHITCTANELLSTSGAGTAIKGVQVVFGLVGLQAVGVAFNSGTGTTLIAIDTEGIWNLAVTGTDDGGAMLISAGDPLYINVTNAVISKIRNNATQIPFGYALAEVAAGAVAYVCPVKVHWDPRSHWLLDDEMLYFGDAMDVNIAWNEAELEMLPLANHTDFLIGNGTNNFDVQIFGDDGHMLWDSALTRLSLVNTALGADTRIASFHGTMATPGMGDGVGVHEIDLTMTGIATGFCTASSTWVNVVGTAQGFVSSWEAITPRNDGVYAAGTTTITNAAIFYGGRFQCILADSDYDVLALFSTNVTQVQTAIFHTNSQPNFGLVAGAHVSAVTGSIPLVCDIAGDSIKYVRVYDTAA